MHAPRRTVILAATIVAITGHTGHAVAQQIVIESYAGPRPDDATYLLRPLQAELVRRGFQAGPDVLGGRIARTVSRPGTPLDPDQVREVVRRIDKGYDKWLSGDFATAISEITAALDLLRAHPSTIAREQRLRDNLFKGLVGLAVAHKRLGNVTDATAAMAELVRSFPDRDLSRVQFGPEAARFYHKVLDELDQQWRGTLSIHVDDPTAVVFINERYIGVGTTVQSDLYPGRYRVYVQRANHAGRVHEIDVQPGTEAAVRVTWDFDAALRTRDDFTGFEFSNEADRAAREARYATTLAVALGTTGVAVLGIRDHNGHRSIVGQVLSLDTAKTIRSAALAVEPVAPSAEALGALGRFLAGDDSAAPLLGEAWTTTGLIASADAPTPRPRRAPASRHHDTRTGSRYRTWSWIALGTGVAAGAAGTALILLDQNALDDSGRRRKSRRQTLVPGLITAGAGVALVITSAVLRLLEPSDAPPASSITLAPVASPTGTAGWGLWWNATF